MKMLYTSQPLNTNLPACTSEEVDCPVVHTFDVGVYVREVTLPANSYILGKKHKHRCINIVSKGKLLLIDISTGDKKVIEAPCTFISEAGVQKLAYVIEETVWSNVHSNPTNTQDLIELEDRLIEKEDYTMVAANKQGKLI